MFRKNMHNWGIRTHDLVHSTYCTSNHYTAGVNILVLLLSLTKIMYKNHCTARQCPLSAGVGHPARAQKRLPHLPGHLARRALTRKSWSFQWPQPLRHGVTQVVQVLKLP